MEWVWWKEAAEAAAIFILCPLIALTICAFWPELRTKTRQIFAETKKKIWPQKSEPVSTKKPPQVTAEVNARAVKIFELINKIAKEEKFEHPANKKKPPSKK